MYLSAPFSSEQQLPQQLRREDAANTESYRGAKGLAGGGSGVEGGERETPNVQNVDLRFFFFFFFSSSRQRHRAFTAEKVT